jgi:hypothetical protein
MPPAPSGPTEWSASCALKDVACDTDVVDRYTDGINMSFGKLATAAKIIFLLASSVESSGGTAGAAQVVASATVEETSARMVPVSKAAEEVASLSKAAAIAAS